MNVVLDTNVIVRMAEVGQVQHRVAISAVDALQLQGATIFLVPQVLYEFWVVATRPLAVNGLALPVPFVASEVSRLTSIFALLPDPPALFTEWQRLVTTHQVVGKNAHDARLVAAMLVHGLTNLLTFNTQDFVRYPAVTALDPAAIPPPAP